MNTISFPGIGIGPFTINEIAFQVPFLNTRGVAWYGIILTFGMIVAFLISIYNAKKENLTSDDVIDVAISAIICGVIGARLYYVVFKGGYTSFYDVIAVWNGGLAIYGAVIGGAIGVAIVGLIKKINLFKIYDLVAPAVLIAQAIGRWGNFVNAEAYGAETKWLLRMGIEIGGVTRYYHPTFLYESVWNLIGFIVLLLLYRKKKFNGQILFSYIVWYGLGRMVIEGLRTDSLYWGTIRVSQLLAFVSAVAGIIILIILGVKSRKDRLMKESYETVFEDKPENEAVSEEIKEVTEAVENVNDTVAEEVENASETAENTVNNAEETFIEEVKGDSEDGNQN